MAGQSADFALGALAASHQHTHTIRQTWRRQRCPSTVANRPGDDSPARGLAVNAAIGLCRLFHVLISCA